MGIELVEENYGDWKTPIWRTTGREFCAAIVRVGSMHGTRDSIWNGASATSFHQQQICIRSRRASAVTFRCLVSICWHVVFILTNYEVWLNASLPLRQSSMCYNWGPVLSHHDSRVRLAIMQFRRWQKASAEAWLSVLHPAPGLHTKWTNSTSPDGLVSQHRPIRLLNFNIANVIPSGQRRYALDQLKRFQIGTRPLCFEWRPLGSVGLLWLISF